MSEEKENIGQSETPEWTHFIAVQVNDENILKNIKEFLNGFFQEFPNSKIREAQQDPDLYHLILFMVQISEDSLERAQNIFEKVTSRYAERLSQTTFRIFNTETFETRRKRQIIHSDVDWNGDEDRIRGLIRDLQDELDDGTEIKCDQNDPWFHCTLFHSAHLDRKYPEKSPFRIPEEEQNYVEERGKLEFGTQRLISVQLLKKNHSSGKYYEIVSEVAF